MRLFVSDSELEKLERDARLGQDVKKVEKRYEKKLLKLEREYQEEIEDLTDAHNRVVHVLERRGDKLELQLEDAEDDVRDACEEEFEVERKQLEAVVAQHKDKVASLHGQVRVLETAVKTDADLTKRELAIQAKEAELEATADLLKTRETALAARIKEVDAIEADKKDKTYKAGFTDGVADTLREGNKLAETANANVFKLAEKALERDTTVITTTQTPAKQGK